MGSAGGRLMPDQQNHLLLIAGTFLIFGMLLIGIPIGVSSQLRFFLGGILIGGAILVSIFSLRTWFK
jgi:hypothetical protein